MIYKWNLKIRWTFLINIALYKHSIKWLMNIVNGILPNLIRLWMYIRLLSMFYKSFLHNVKLYCSVSNFFVFRKLVILPNALIKFNSPENWILKLKTFLSWFKMNLCRIKAYKNYYQNNNKTMMEIRRTALQISWWSKQMCRQLFCI